LLFQQYYFYQFKLQVKRSTNCEECLNILKNDDHFGDTTLINVKEYGQLTYPSVDTQEVCKLAESVFQQCNTSKNLNTRNIRSILINNTKRLFQREYYLVQHMVAEEAEMHQSSIISNILTQYFNIRLFHYGKKLTEQFRIKSKRVTYNNLIQFNGV
jgi:hypothetical protein